MTHQGDLRQFLEKTELCEVAPNPSEGTMEILRLLYRDGGPVARAYRRCGIEYRDTDFLVVVGGELLVDREKELQSLFPSHSYFFDETRTPRPVRLKGFWTSLKNTRRFKNLRCDVGEVMGQVKERLDRLRKEGDRKVLVDQFLEDYEWIFLGNLCAERAVNRLKSALPKGMTIADVLQYVPSTLSPMWEVPEGIVGNTFELTDTSIFASFMNSSTGSRASAKEIPVGMPMKELEEAQELLRLREYGRWLAMKGLMPLRVAPSVAHLAQGGNPPIAQVQRLPMSPIGVSAGEAEGVLVDHPEEVGIWVLKTLSPELVNHLKGVKGVIAKNGGLLSHFSIIAREMGIPVVVKYPIETLVMGKRVKMNGSTGEVMVQ